MSEAPEKILVRLIGPDLSGEPGHWWRAMHTTPDLYDGPDDDPSLHAYVRGDRYDEVVGQNDAMVKALEWATKVIKAALELIDSAGLLGDEEREELRRVAIDVIQRYVEAQDGNTIPRTLSPNAPHPGK